MSIKHIAMVLDAEGLEGPEKLLLIAYCNYTDAHGYCWPGQQRITDDCGTSPATVKRVKKKLIEKKLIASMRRINPRTGEPITNLTRVNLELLAAMKRKAADYDDNMVERLTFEADPPLPTKKKKAPKRPGQNADQVRAQDEPDLVDNFDTPSDLLRAHLEPDPGLILSPTRVQDEPDYGFKMSPRSGQVEPLTVSDPPQNHQETVPPSPVGSPKALTREGGRDGRQFPQEEIPRTEGVRFLLELGNTSPKLMITGQPLQDQGLIVDELFRRGWKDEVLWELLTRPLPKPLRKDVSAIISKRLRDALESPLPGPRRTWEDEETPLPQQYAAGGNLVVRRHYECDGDHGLCGVPVEAEGDQCRVHAREPQSTW